MVTLVIVPVIAVAVVILTVEPDVVVPAAPVAPVGPGLPETPVVPLHAVIMSSVANAESLGIRSRVLHGDCMVQMLPSLSSVRSPTR
jgi:hypothetical protein